MSPPPLVICPYTHDMHHCLYLCLLLHLFTLLTSSFPYILPLFPAPFYFTLFSLRLFIFSPKWSQSISPPFSNLRDTPVRYSRYCIHIAWFWIRYVIYDMEKNDKEDKLDRIWTRMVRRCTYKNVVQGSVYFSVQWFFKLTMLHVVLDRQEISKTILEKAFFFIVWCFCLFSVFVWKNFEIDPSERWKFFSWNRSQKIENFMLISKKQTCLSD